MNDPKMPQNSKNAERSLLGALLRWNNIIAEVVPLVQPDDFYSLVNQQIYAAIVNLWGKGQRVDLVTLAEALKGRGQLEDQGGYAYLASLWDCEPTGALACHYAEIVREKAILRKLNHAANEILLDVESPVGTAADVLESAEAKIIAVAQHGVRADVVSIGEGCARALQDSDRLDNGVPSGFLDIDILTTGFKPGELTVLAARPSHGKTALAISFLLHAAQEGFPALFFSLEQSEVEISQRLLASEANVDFQKIRRRKMSPEDKTRMNVAHDNIRALPLFIDKTPCQSMLRITATARRMALKHKLRLIVVDYVQLIQPEDRRTPRHEQVALISRRLKLLARDLDVAVIALAQLNRSPEERQNHRPRMADLKESGALEQDADLGILLNRPSVHDPAQRPGEVEVIVGKNRNGPTGDLILSFDGRFMRFSNYFPKIGGHP